MTKSERIELAQKRRIEAEKAYLASMDELEGKAWAAVVEDKKRSVEHTLGATRDLKRVRAALLSDGSHMEVLRHFMAPPLSQDQFKLACKPWPKGSEKSGAGVRPDRVDAVIKAWDAWKDEGLAKAVQAGGREWASAVFVVSSMMAVRSFQTDKRMKLARIQEGDAIEVLERLGYTKKPRVNVTRHGIIGRGEFMHAVQFATADGSSHEVDIAVGLRGGVVLALECKVSNDATNSIKRVNDVLMKATAWKKQWGTFVVTGALLQGVFSAKEPRRLVDGDVRVFWSHHLADLESWLKTHG